VSGRPSFLRRTHLAAAAVAALGILLSTSSAIAGEKEEARRHFRAGMEAIQNGNYEKGIAELRAAYEILPHPNVLYNIARAYAESGDLESAVQFYRRYLAENPPDKEEVEGVVRSIEARLAKSKAAAAAAAAAAAGGPAPGGPTGTVPGTEIPEPGSGSSGTGANPAGSTGTGEPAKRTGQGLAAGVGDLGERKEENVYETKVVTASKQAQSPLDSPSSTYIITEQDIRLSGATNLAEVMRRVPGIDISQITPADYNLSIRGFNGRLSNKLLVLVNGRSVYLDFLGTTFWDALSINVEDIERVEVVRGPGSALYGADAFTGVVNIITKEPGEGKNGFSAGIGTQRGAPFGYYRGALWATGKSSGWNYRISTGYEQSPRWSREVAPGRTDLQYFTPNYDLGNDQLRADARFTRRLSKDVTLGFGGGYSDYYRNMYAIGALTDTGVNARMGDVTAFLNSTHFNARAFFFKASAVGGPSLNYLGDPRQNLTLDSNIGDIELQYANDFKTGPLLHDVRVGVGYRYKDIAWNYLDLPFRVEHHRNAYLQDQIRIGEKFIVVGSIRADYVPYLQQTIASPRGSIIYKRTTDDAFRFTISSAFRKPTFLESYLDYGVTTPNTGAEVLSQAAKQDDPGYRTQRERITALEVGYTNQASDFFSFEVNAYYNRVSDLIVIGDLRAQTPSTFARGAGGYNDATGRYTAGFTGFTNDCQIFDSYGGEAGIRAFPATGLDVFGSYAFNNVDQTAPTGCRATIEDQRTSRHKVTAGAQFRTKFGLDAEATFWFQSAQVWAEQRTNIATREIEYQRYPIDAFALVNARIGYRFQAEPLDIGLSAFNLFDNRIRQHPFGQLLGRRVLLMATYRF
jgi:iron complex outermembrane receptor protein